MKLIIEKKVLKTLQEDFNSPSSEQTKDRIVRLILSCLRSYVKRPRLSSVSIRITTEDVLGSVQISDKGSAD